MDGSDGGFRWPRMVDLLGRAMLAALFLWSGVFGIVLAHADVVDMIAARGLPLPGLAAAAAGAVEIGAPIALFLRRTERPAALVLALYCLATALIFHAYWTQTGTARFEEQVHFLKDLALAGAFLTLAARRSP